MSKNSSIQLRIKIWHRNSQIIKGKALVNTSNQTHTTSNKLMFNSGRNSNSIKNNNKIVTHSPMLKTLHLHGLLKIQIPNTRANSKWKRCKILIRLARTVKICTKIINQSLRTHSLAHKSRIRLMSTNKPQATFSKRPTWTKMWLPRFKARTAKTI